MRLLRKSLDWSGEGMGEGQQERRVRSTTTSPRLLYFPTTWFTYRLPQILVGSETHSDFCLCCRSRTADCTYCGEGAKDLKWTRRSCNLFRCTVTNTNTTPPVQLPLVLRMYLTIPVPLPPFHAPPPLLSSSYY